MPITDKQRAFAREFLKDSNRTAAAERAGYSAKSAKAMGSREYGKPEVQAEIARLQQQAADIALLDRAWVLEQLIGVAGAGKKSENVRAMELLGKEIGMFKDRLEHSGPDGQPIPTSLSIRFVKAGSSDRGGN